MCTPAGLQESPPRGHSNYGQSNDCYQDGPDRRTDPATCTSDDRVPPLSNFHGGATLRKQGNSTPPLSLSMIRLYRPTRLALFVTRPIRQQASCSKANCP